MVELFISFKISTHDVVDLCRILLALSLSHLTESVPELPSDQTEVPHPTGSGGLPPLSLDRPAERPDLGRGKATRSTHLLLNVECHLAAPPAQSVRLVAPLSKGTGTLGHGVSLVSSEINDHLVERG